MIVSKLKIHFNITKDLFKVYKQQILVQKHLNLCENLNFRFRFFSTEKHDVDFVSQKSKCTEKSEDTEEITVTNRISNILKCSLEDGKHILNSNPKLGSTPNRNITKRLLFLEEKNITPELILNNPWLLTGDKRLLEEKLGMLQRGTKTDLGSALQLLQLPVKRLQRVLQLNRKQPGQDVERIDFLAEKLMCTQEEACELLQKHEFLLTIPFPRMLAIITLLEEAGVDKLDVQRDPWILRYQPAQVKVRLDMARNVGMLKIKPWLARSTEKVFNRSLERYKESQKLLGSDRTVLEFLTRKLGLKDPNQVIEIARTHPALLRASPIKLGSVLDALIDQGFTTEDIIKSPRVLCHRLSTLLERLALIRETYNQEPKSLSVLCLSKKQFNKYTFRLKKIQNMKITKQEIKLNYPDHK